MYDTCFKFNARPFSAVPQIELYFPGTAVESSRTKLLRCLQRGEGIGMVVGPSGTGKTLLCQVLAEQLKESFRVALLLSGRLASRRALLQAILYSLGRPYREMDEGELRLSLVDFLTAGEDCPQAVVLLVDEAHTLPLRLLEEIRMLTNIARDGQPQVRLVLAGGCVLEERFASPKLDSFNQRIVARCYLESLNRNETQEYIHARVESVGGAAAEIFPAQTCQSVYQATDGVPRLINQVCDHALMLAYVRGQDSIEPMCVEEAWADLQQLPTPRTEEPQEGATEGVVEFGCLDDVREDECDFETDRSEPASLRISPDTHQLDQRAAEPERQLERIEEMLAEADDDFRPAGTIRPEVELVFHDPFEEAFEEEEVIADRYVSGDTGERTAAEYEQPAVSIAEAEAEQPTVTVVEADAEPQLAAGPVATARRREYGRLFAKLRSR